MQMVATGAVGSVAEGRALVDRSFPTEVFHPDGQAVWEEGSTRMKQLIGAGV